MPNIFMEMIERAGYLEQLKYCPHLIQERNNRRPSITRTEREKVPDGLRRRESYVVEEGYERNAVHL